MKELSITLTDKERETLIHALLIAQYDHNVAVRAGVNTYYHIEENARIDHIIEKIIEKELTA